MMAIWGLPKRSATKAVSLRFEPLEARCLLSAAPVAEPAGVTTKGDGLIEYHAVICGVADYEGDDSDLAYADDDAISFRNALLEGRNWDESNITMLLNAKVTESAVRNAFTGMGEAADEDDVCVFFFAGHGTQVPDVEPMDEYDGMDEGICTYSLSTEVITDDELTDMIADLPTEKYAVFIGACHSGGLIASGGVRGIGDTVPEEGDGFAADFAARDTKDLHDLGHGVVLTACRESELAIEGSAWRHGLFVYHLLGALTGAGDVNDDGAVSAEESYDYLKNRVIADNYEQHPQIFDGYPGELRLIQHEGNFIVEEAEALETSEDGVTATFKLSLACEPSGDVAVTLQSSDATEGTVSPKELVFTAEDWSIPREITFTGVDDDLADGNVQYSIRATTVSADGDYDGKDIPYFSVTNRDNESAVISGMVWNDYDGDGEVGFGETPLAGRTVFLDDGDGVFDPETDQAVQTNASGEYRFEWLSPGDYTVMSLPPEPWITTTPAGGSYVLSLEADEQAPGTDFGFAASALTVTVPTDAAETAGTVTGTVSIPLPAAQDMVVSLRSDNTSEAEVPATATILAGETAVDFDVTVHDDAELDGDQAVSVTATAVGFRAGSSVITILDNEALDAPTLDAEPVETEGTSNIVSWSAVPGATGYFVERASDAGFTTIAADSGWITETSYEFDGLTAGATYFYRVKSRTQFDASFDTWTQTDQADFDADLLDGTVSTVDGSVELAVGPKVLGAADFEEGGLQGWELGSNGIRVITAGDGADGTDRAFQMRGGGEGDYYAYRNRLPLGKVPTGMSFYVQSNSTETSDGHVSLIDGDNGPLAGEAVLWFYCGDDGKFFVNDEAYSTFRYEADRWYHVEVALDWAGQSLDVYVDSALVYEDVPFRGEDLSRVTYLELNNFDAESVAAWDEITFEGAGSAFGDTGTIISTPIAPPVLENWGTVDFATTTNAQTGVTVDLLDENGAVLAENLLPGTDVGTIAGDADVLFLRANLSTESGSMTPSLNEWSINWQRTAPFVESDWSAVESSLQSDRSLSIDLSADTAWEGEGGLQAVVSLPHAFPYDVTVDLTAPAEVDVPAQATILSGNTEVIVPFSLIDNTDVDGGRDALIAVSRTDFSGADESIQVLDDEVASVVFGQIASPQTEDVPFGVDLTVYNIDGQVLVMLDATVDLSAVGVGVTPATAQLVDGQWTGQVTVDAPATGLTLSAQVPSGTIGTSNAFDVQSSGASIPGDLNGDGVVSGPDLDIIRSFWAQTVPPGELSMGDPSGDGMVGGADLDIVRSNWGTTAAASAVPVSAGAKESPATTAPSAADARALAQAAWDAELNSRANGRKERKAAGPQLVDWVFANEWS